MLTPFLCPLHIHRESFPKHIHSETLARGSFPSEIPRSLIGNFPFPPLITLIFAGLEVLFPEHGVLLPGPTPNIPLNQKFRLPSGHFELLMPSSQQQAKKGITVLGGLIDLDYQGDIRLLLHMEV